MRARILTVAVAGLLWVAAPVSAQVLSVEFHDGRVRLTAENVPVSRILAEWARVGGTRIVNGERIPGPPVSLQLVDIPERQALDTVLRGAAGYLVSARDTFAPGTSAFEKVMVLPTSSRAPTTPAPAPVQQAPQFIDRSEDPTDDGPEPPQGAPGAPGPFQRGRVQSGIPPGVIVAPPPPDNELPPQDVAPPSPANPFGVPAGSNRPGSIAPVPQRNPNDRRPQ